MPGGGDHTGVGVLPCQTENRVRRTQHRLGVKAVGEGHFEDPWGEVEMVVVVIGCQEREIAWGRGFCPAKP